MGVLRKIVSSVIPAKYKGSTMKLFQKVLHNGLITVSGGAEEALFWAHAQAKLTPYTLIQGFLQGTFPMPQVDNNDIFIWFDPDPRGIIPVADFKIRKELLTFLKKNRLQEAHKRFEVKLNTNFEQTVRNCANPRGDKTTTWITPEYMKVMLELHEMGIAHSVETYQNDKLIGGAFGVSLNGYFVSLSVFRTIDNAGKVAICYLLNKLKEDGFKLHISGAADSWLTQFGAVNISKEDFKKELIKAIISPVIFSPQIPELTI